MKNYIKILCAVAALTVILTVAFLVNRKQGSQSNQNSLPGQNGASKIKVVTTFYPLYDAAKNVGQDRIELINLTPPGAEPHDFEPSAKDLAKVYNSQVFIFNGNGVDAWAEKISDDLKAKGVVVLNMSHHLDSLGSYEEDPGTEDGGAHNKESELDPHFWLDPTNMQKEAALIADALAQADKTNEQEYNQNKDAYQLKLRQLDLAYAQGLKSCMNDTIVTSHNAFNYLAKRYNLKTLFILGLSPEEEPSAKAIAEISTIAKQKNIKYIFFETLVSPKLSETIAQEIGALTLELNPIEGLTADEIVAGQDYVSKMYDNLGNLKISLQCQ